MEIRKQREYQQFQENVEKFLRHPQDRDAANFLFGLFNLWMTFFFRDYQGIWGNTFSPVEEQDLRQEIIIKFFEALRKNHIVNYQEAKAYLLRTFQTKCIDAIRKKDRQFLRLEEEANNEAFIFLPSETSSQFSLSEKFQIIKPYWQEALAQSHESTRKIINSLYWGLPYEEICRQLGGLDYSPKNFKAKVHRAKRAFQKTLLSILMNAISEESLNSVEREILEGISKSIQK